MVDTFEQLLGGEELYHYHSKLMMKEVMTMTKTKTKTRVISVPQQAHDEGGDQI